MPIFSEWTVIVRVARSVYLTTLAFVSSYNLESVQGGLKKAFCHEACYLECKVVHVE